MKLTRAQIKEGLQSMPIERLLVGAAKTLTAKQKKFAEEVAKGSPKAKAYRTAYDTQALPATQANEAQRLVKHPAIASMIEAQKLAIEAQKYTTPLHLRALTIHNLTMMALDTSVKPAQRLKAMELLGKITEVALFTERREVVQVTDSEVMRAKLLQSLRLAMDNSTAITAEYTSADDLLSEISGSNAGEEAENIPGEVTDDAPPGSDDAMLDGESVDK